MSDLLGLAFMGSGWAWHDATLHCMVIALQSVIFIDRQIEISLTAVLRARESGMCVAVAATS
jgi:hypothetical protein